MDNKLILQLYGRYFFYLELERSTQVIAAYMGDQLVGVLLAEMKNETKKFQSSWRKSYISIFEFLMSVVVKDGPDIYNDTNKEMLKDYTETVTPDGEICFLAADPTIQGKGIGSLLLEELSQREKDKLVYLYTDSNCSYHFYDRKGFDRAKEKEITMDLGSNKVRLTCFLYSKQLN